jgi:T5SS/PEP-CTERM-associated repeat protein
MKAIVAASRLISAALAVMAYLQVTDAFAQTRIWNASTGNWATAANWTPNQLPNSGVDAEINNAGTAQLQVAGSVRDLYLGVPIAGFGHLQLSAAGVLSGRDGLIAVGQGSIASATLTGSTARWNARNLVLGDLGTATLEIREAADIVNTGFAVFGQQSGGAGTATVNGVGSTWTNTLDISVGVLSSGELNIEAGGSVISRDLLIGTGIGSIGTVRVTGTGSSWARNNSSGSGQIEVGGFGKGTLFVSGGGSVGTIGESSIGRQASPSFTSAATITGAGSNWTMAVGSGDTLNVGYAGKAELNLLDGGIISGVNTAYVARDASSTAKVTVDGTGSAWQTGGEMNVGYGGTGTLEVKRGGTVSSGFNIGGLAGSTGTVTVTDPGSQITGGGTIGDAGTGTLSISLDGDVVSQSVTIGNQTGSNGTATIDGPGCTWQATGLVIGNAGTGTLTVKNGADVNNNSFTNSSGTIGGVAGSVGTVTVEGAGSTWSNNFDLSVGEGGEGTLRIKDAGAVSANFGSLGDGAGSVGHVVIETNSTWTIANTLLVGSQGEGTVMITGAGKLFTNGSNPNFGSSIGGAPGGVGTVSVDGAGSEWISPAAGLYVGVSGGTGTLNITNGADVSNGEAILGRGFELGAHGTVNVNGAGSSWTNSGRLDVGLVGTGVVNVSSGGAISSASARIGGQATGVGTVSIGAGSTWNNAGTIEVGINGNGTLEILSGGTVTAPGGTTIDVNGASGTGSGRLTGAGTLVSNVTNNGIVAPGASPGTLDIVGNYFHGSSGKLQIEIAAPNSFDKLEVTGQASLFGSLEIILLNGFIPSVNDSFEILTAGTRNFMFASVTVTTNSMPAGAFNVVYTPTSVVLSNFVPAFIPGDFDSDGDVDGADFVAWQTNFPTATGATLAQGDADGDGDVDGADFVVWQTNFPFTPGPGAVPVPEPAGWSLMLLALAAAGFVSRFASRAISS